MAGVVNFILKRDFAGARTLISRWGRNFQKAAAMRISMRTILIATPRSLRSAHGARHRSSKLLTQTPCILASACERGPRRSSNALPRTGSGLSAVVGTKFVRHCGLLPHQYRRLDRHFRWRPRSDYRCLSSKSNLTKCVPLKSRVADYQLDNLPLLNQNIARFPTAIRCRQCGGALSGPSLGRGFAKTLINRVRLSRRSTARVLSAVARALTPIRGGAACGGSPGKGGDAACSP